MGVRQLMQAVADAGPLIHLHEIGALVVLSMFERLYVPKPVYGEMLRHLVTDSPSLEEWPFLHLVDIEQERVQAFVREHGLEYLHWGEQTALCVAYQKHVPLFLTDDLKARQVAKSLGLKPVGSVGLILRAYNQGQISKTVAKRYIIDLQERSSLFITRALIEFALQKLDSMD